MKRTILVAALMAAPVLCSTAGDLTEQYALKQRCGEQVARAFNDGGNKEGMVEDAGWLRTTTYEAHFNSKTLKCFMSYKNEATPVRDKSLWRTTDLEVIEVNENKTYASFQTANGTVMGCSVGPARCQTATEWDRMVEVLFGE